MAPWAGLPVWPRFLSRRMSTHRVVNEHERDEPPRLLRPVKQGMNSAATTTHWAGTTQDAIWTGARCASRLGGIEPRTCSLWSVVQ